MKQYTKKNYYYCFVNKLSYVSKYEDTLVYLTDTLYVKDQIT